MFEFKNIYFISLEKQILATYTNLSQIYFQETEPVLVWNVWATGYR